MYTFARFYTIMFVSQVLYWIGDIACRLPFEWSADLYQLVMKKSFELDEVIGFQIWKE